MCLVAFQKIFRKIFFGVWKRRRKTQIRKHKATTQEKKSSTITTQDRDRRRWSDLDRDRDHGAIAISDRDRAVDRDHGAVVGLKTFMELMIFFSGLWLVACVF